MDETTSITDESNMTLEEKRREARKKRIAGNTANRLSYIQSHTPELKNEPDPIPEPTTVTSPKSTGTGNNTTADIMGETGLPINIASLLNQFSGMQPSSSSSTTQYGTTSKDEPLSFKILRWIGILFFSLIFLINAMLSAYPELLETSLASSTTAATNIQETILQKYQWIFRILQISTTGSKNNTSTQLLYVYGTLLAVWVLWEFIIVKRMKSKHGASSLHLKQSTFLSFARSDALLIAFVYACSLDCILRFKHLIFPSTFLLFIRDDYLVSVLYYPFVIALIGQWAINYISKTISIIHVDPKVYKIYQGVTHFGLSLLILLICIDWWECSSIHCSTSFGLLWILASKSRGLFLWSHICINFASRILN